MLGLGDLDDQAADGLGGDVGNAGSMLICDVSRGYKAGKFKKDTADMYMASIERNAEDGPDSYLPAKLYSIKNADDLLAHNLVEYNRTKPPQRSLAKLIEVAPPVMDLGGGAAAAAAHARLPPPGRTPASSAATPT